MAGDEASAGRELLLDAFGRVRELVPDVVAELTQEELAHRLDGHGNSIAWLVWHLIRIQDDHVAGLAGVEQAWTERGWFERSGLPYGPEEHGYGHSSEQVDAAGSLSAELLIGYHADVDALTRRYLEGVDSQELARVVDRSWDPPVTASVRLVSVLGDSLQHLGQAGYIKGLLLARR
jgi:uncharacterized damage-inducible protein DinB